DSFDDLAAADALPPDEGATLASLMAGRHWLWITGNHDPGPLALGGSHADELRAGGLSFRHVATPGASGEVSGHYHPKATIAARGQRLTRPAFLIDRARVILPAFGAYTGGLHADRPPLSLLMRPGAMAVLTGRGTLAVPVTATRRRTPFPPGNP
ncbi:MAG: metallophosphoesterase, partial [Rhodobacteraceae bacterium]|nr:metallophosphoesterase [Paracoccaceae bacterium]